MDQIRISAKNLGQTALADFCPRCYWIKLKLNFKLPWQSFPGIFSSIDAYTKSCVHHIIDSSNERQDTRSVKSAGSYYEYPDWMKQIGDVIGYETVPHWSKNKYHDEKSNITFQGSQDDIFVLADGTRCCPDYKTAKHTDTQDKLFPMYEIQSNVYGILMGDNPKLCLVYMEPDTDKSSACDNIIDQGFRMCFNAVVVPIENDKKKVRQALAVTRDVYESATPPQGNSDCKDCQALDKVMKVMGVLK